MADPASYRPPEIPEDPGVYRFYNDKEKVIYVGKAKNLKNRLSSYFGSNLAQKTYRMVHEAVRVDWTIVKTELEALALEFSWIKQYHPTYNVQFKDDKSYPYLAISIEDEYPRIFITRKEKRPGLKYFGPYTNAWALRNTYEVLLKVFPVRSCSVGNFQRAQKTKRQCLLGDIGKCAAPCVGWVTPDQHRQIAVKLNEFMESGMEDLLPAMRSEMELASSREEFERAARLRDQIESFEKRRNRRKEISPMIWTVISSPSMKKDSTQLVRSLWFVAVRLRAHAPGLLTKRELSRGRTSGPHFSSLFMAMVRRISLPRFTSIKIRPILTHSLPG